MIARAKVVVTGASGHIGFHVARKLLAKGYGVHLLLRGENVLTHRLREAGADVHIVDLAAPASYNEVLRDSAALFHLAATNTTSQRDAAKVLDATVGLTRRVIETARESEVATIIYTSSVVVLGRSASPVSLVTEEDWTTLAESPYARGKSEAERYCRAQIEAGLDIRILYPSWVMGPDDPKCTPPHKVVTDFVAKGQPFYFAGGVSIAHVEEVADAHIAALEVGARGGRYLLGGANITFRKLFQLLAEYSGRRPPALLLPKAAIVILARLLKHACRLADREPPLDPGYAEAVVGNYSWYDSSRATAELNYRIRPIEETLREAVLHARMRLAGTYRLNLKLARAKSTSAAVVETDNVLLITGCPGWLGNRMIELLANGSPAIASQPNRKVRLLVERHSCDLLKLPANFEIFPGDLTDRADLGQALMGVTTVFHLAGAIYPRRIATLYKVNTEGTRNLVDVCIEKGVRRILFMSTDSVCGHGTKDQHVFDEQTRPAPYKDYGRSKWLAEDYLLSKSAEGLVDATSLRGFWFFGPYAPARQLNFVRMFSWSRQLVFGNGRNLRSISHVDNIVAAFLQAEDQARTYGRWYWVGDEAGGYTVNDIYQTIARALGRPYRPLYIPAFLCQLIDLLDDLLAFFGRLHPTIHAAAKFRFDIAGSSAAASRDFGYKAHVSLQEAAAELAAASITQN